MNNLATVDPGELVNTLIAVDSYLQDTPTFLNSHPEGPEQAIKDLKKRVRNCLGGYDSNVRRFKKQILARSQNIAPPLNIHEAAAILGVSDDHLRRCCRAGHNHPKFWQIGKRGEYKFDREDVMEYKRRQKKTAKPGPKPKRKNAASNFNDEPYL